MKVGVIGYGVVGHHMVHDIQAAGMEPVIHDPAKGFNARPHGLAECAGAFVCVGTPERTDGACDVSAIQDVFTWLRVPVAIIRSTIPPGTTDRLSEQCPAVFCPEFIGEGVNPPYLAMRQPPFLVLGGAPEARTRAADVFARLYNSECEVIHTDARTAEVAKYAENYFLALKVSWANDLFDICQSVGADFGMMMNAVTHDYRIGRSHTHVYPDQRGWSGRCLPKDTAALLASVGPQVAPLLAALRQANEQHRQRSSVSEAMEATL